MTVSEQKTQIPVIPREQAAYCMDCGCVFQINPHGCPACASQVFGPVSTWIGGASK